MTSSLQNLQQVVGPEIQFLRYGPQQLRPGLPPAGEEFLDSAVVQSEPVGDLVEAASLPSTALRDVDDQSLLGHGWLSVSRAVTTCFRCGHALREHCPGGVRHAAWKDEQKMRKNPRVHSCEARHCLQPMCSCVAFAEAW